MIVFTFAPPQTRDLQSGDQFKYTLSDKYTYSSHFGIGSETGVRTTTYSKASINGKSCLEERAVTKSITPDHHVETYELWIKGAEPAKGQTVAYTFSDRPPLILSTISLHQGEAFGPGATWSEHFAAPDGSVADMHARALKWETIAVPAGKFPCLAIGLSQNTSGHGRSQTTTGVVWWSPALGGYPKLDYLESVNVNKTYGTVRRHYILRLASYKLAGQKK